MSQPYGGQYGNEPDRPQYGQPEARFEQPGQQPYPGQYGRPSEQPYGQQGRYSATANAYGAPVGSGARFGVVGTTFAGIGAVLLVISFTAVNWFTGSSPSGFSDIRDLSDTVPGFDGLAKAYFGWLAWLLAAVVVLVAVAANLPSPASGPLRALGAIIAAAAIAVTFFAIQLTSQAAYTEFLKDARLGFYFAVGGFLLAGIGALVGPKRR